MALQEVNFINDDEILVQAQAVKYHSIDYAETYIVITQHRTRRRIYQGYYFEDNGSHIYVSTLCVDIFQHKQKVKKFIVNIKTKEWRNFQHVLIERHKPDKIEPVDNNLHEELIKYSSRS